MKLRERLKRVADPRGKQGQDYPLFALLQLIIVALLCGRRGMAAVHRFGRALSDAERRRLGFFKDVTPCHATLTETLRKLDPRSLIAALDVALSEENHVAIDGKTMRGSKDEEGRAEHVLSVFCTGLQEIIGTESSRGKGLEIPDALKLIEKMDLTDKVVTGDAIFCQRHISEKIVEKKGDYLFPVKKNQKTLHENIEMAFAEPVFPPQKL